VRNGCSFFCQLKFCRVFGPSHNFSFKKHPAAAESAKKLPRFNDRATGCVLFRSFADSVLNIA
jgi:hypothetical protein